MATKSRIETESKPTSTVEQYIKVIFSQQEGADGEVVGMKQLADAMAVTPGTATAMVKHLSAHAMVDYTPRKGVLLTATGWKLAVTMIRRHRLIETFLEQVLGYDWTEVHEDAEALEHAVSERFIERIDTYLEYPQTDPHGDPIPDASGAIERRLSVPLDRCSEGDQVTVVRIGDEDPEFLFLMKEHMLTPGEVFLVTELNPTAGTLSVCHIESKALFTLGLAAGARILVAPIH